MATFSERQGVKPAKSVIQVDSIDTDLCNSIWNVLTVFALGDADFAYDEIDQPRTEHSQHIATFVRILWIRHFKLPLEDAGTDWRRIRKRIYEHFFTASWNEVYDFVEFTVNSYPELDLRAKLQETFNSVMQRELSAYRFLDGVLTPISSEQELGEIDRARDSARPLIGVYTHLDSALRLLLDRKQPDYRNSVKESISAVEAMCRQIAANAQTLGECLKTLGKTVPVHGALRESFSKLYGWSSDAQGIRHSLMDEPTLQFEDAKFMLVSCSAFVNYLIAKAAWAGIKLA